MIHEYDCITGAFEFPIPLALPPISLFLSLFVTLSVCPSVSGSWAEISPTRCFRETSSSSSSSSAAAAWYRVILHRQGRRCRWQTWKEVEGNRTGPCVFSTRVILGSVPPETLQFFAGLRAGRVLRVESGLLFSKINVCSHGKTIQVSGSIESREAFTIERENRFVGKCYRSFFDLG